MKGIRYPAKYHWKMAWRLLRGVKTQLHGSYDLACHTGKLAGIEYSLDELCDDCSPVLLDQFAFQAALIHAASAYNQRERSGSLSCRAKLYMRKLSKLQSLPETPDLTCNDCPWEGDFEEARNAMCPECESSNLFEMAIPF